MFREIKGGIRMNDTIVSTGLDGLDQAIGFLHPGENVVWQIKSVADYMYVATQFVMSVARTGKRIVYFRFGGHGRGGHGNRRRERENV